MDKSGGPKRRAWRERRGIVDSMEKGYQAGWRRWSPLGVGYDAGPAAARSATAWGPYRPDAPRRRPAALAILFAVVVVVALIIHTIGGLMSAARDASKQAAAQTTTPTTDAVSPCTSANVTAYVTPDAATIKPGWKLTNAFKL